jgi:hypothetical protein
MGSYKIIYSAVKYGCSAQEAEPGMAGDFDSSKRELHQLIDQLPTEQVTAAMRFMQYLCADPVLLSLLNAPPDDEPYTQGQRARDAEAEAAIAGGDGISHDEVLHEFGL